MTFDVDLLQKDLEIAGQFVWRPETPFMVKDFYGSDPTVYHDGKWTGLGLVTQGGSAERTDPGGPGLETFVETEALKRTSYFREVINALSCPKRSVRLSLLPPGGSIQEHCDTYHHVRFGQIRLHIPLVTHEDVLMKIGGQRVRWGEGELWYGDFSQPHMVENNSRVTRVHIVMDVVINPFVLSLFPAELVDQWKVQGIVMHRDTIDLPRDVLKELTCQFIVPQSLISGIFELDDGTPGQIQGSIRLEGSRLVFYVENRAMFGLQPITPRRFYITGWVGERYLEFRKVGGRVSFLKLVMKNGKYRSQVTFPIV